jgi:hypothetical protein
MTGEKPFQDEDLQRRSDLFPIDPTDVYSDQSRIQNGSETWRSLDRN